MMLPPDPEDLAEVIEPEDLTPGAPETVHMPRRHPLTGETDAERADRRIAQLTDNYLRDPKTGERWNATTFPGVPMWLAYYAGGKVVDITYRLAKQHAPHISRLEVLEQLLAHPERRLELLEEDPALALLHYFHDEISVDVGDGRRVVAFNDLNLDLLREARLWCWNTREIADLLGDDAPYTNKAIVGPRESGKSHMMIKLLPLWALAFGHIRFLVLATDTKDNAANQFDWWIGRGEENLEDPDADTRGQLIKNTKFLHDFPGMGEWSVSGKTITFASGAIAAVDHIDGSWRGLARGRLRPDLVLADDVDARPAGKLERRLASLTRALKYLGRDAWMYLMGTTTTYGNITHQLMMHIFDKNEAARPAWTWNWETIYCPPIRTDDLTGEEYSFWPAHPSPKLRLDGREGLRKQREKDPTWALEMENRPELGVGGRWSKDAYVRVASLDEFEAEELLLHLDPAKTSSETSDYSAVCVVAINRREGKVAVVLTAQTRMLGLERTAWVQEIVDGFEALGRPISGVIVEANTAGEDFYALFRTLTVPLWTQHVGGQRDANGMAIDKDARIIRSSVHYMMGRVVHVGYQRVEEQQLAYGAASLPHDDLIDVTASAILWVFDPQMLGVPKQQKQPRTGKIGQM